MGLSEQELNEIEARAKAASKPPWVVRERDRLYDGDGGPILSSDYFGGSVVFDEDAVFMAQAREDVPRLVAEVRRLREALRQIAFADYPYDPGAYGSDHAVQRLALRTIGMEPVEERDSSGGR